MIRRRCVLEIIDHKGLRTDQPQVVSRRARVQQEGWMSRRDSASKRWLVEVIGCRGKSDRAHLKEKRGRRVLAIGNGGLTGVKHGETMGRSVRRK